MGYLWRLPFVNERESPLLTQAQTNKFDAPSFGVEMGGIEPPSRTKILILLRV